MHLGAPNCSLPLPQRVGQATTAQSPPQQTDQGSPSSHSTWSPPLPRTLLSLQAKAFLVSCIIFVTPTQVWSRDPSLVFAVLQSSRHNCVDPPNPNQADSSPWVEETTAIPHSPALSLLFCMSRSPASTLVPFTGAQDWANYSPFTKRVLKPLMHE